MKERRKRARVVIVIPSDDSDSEETKTGDTDESLAWMRTLPPPPQGTEVHPNRLLMEPPDTLSLTPSFVDFLLRDSPEPCEEDISSPVQKKK